MSDGAAGPETDSASMWLSLENTGTEASSAGSSGPGVTRNVVSSQNASSLRPATFHRSAAVAPSSESANPSSSASSRAASASMGPGRPSASKQPHRT